MSELGSESLIGLIADPAAPTALSLGSGGKSDARVDDLVLFVQGRLGTRARAEIEAALDHVIASHGGRRVRAVDLNRLPANLWRRMRGRPYETGPEMYEIPQELFAQAGARQRAVQPPPNQ